MQQIGGATAIAEDAEEPGIKALPLLVARERAIEPHEGFADDVVQETFVRLYRALPRYEERQRFDSWLFRILGNCCRTANLLHQRRESLDAGDDAALLNVPSTDRPDA